MVDLTLEDLVNILWVNDKILEAKSINHKYSLYYGLRQMEIQKGNFHCCYDFDYKVQLSREYTGNKEILSFQ